MRGHYPHVLRYEQLGAEGSERNRRDPHGGELFCFRERRGGHGKDRLARRNGQAAPRQAFRSWQIHLTVQSGTGGGRADLGGSVRLFSRQDRPSQRIPPGKAVCVEFVNGRKPMPYVMRYSYFPH